MRVLGLAILLGCSRRETPLRPDPAPPAPPKPEPSPVQRMLHAGHVVDLDARKVLLEQPPSLGVLDDLAAFLVNRAGEVSAHELDGGKERFRVKPPRCAQLAITDHEVHCMDGLSLHAIDKVSGAIRTVTASHPILQVLGVGRHVIVVRHGSLVESIEERTGRVAASLTLPIFAFPPLSLDGGGFCAASPAPGSTLFAGCWSETLTPRWSRTITVAKPGDPSFTAWPRKLAGGFLVGGTDRVAKVKRAVVVRLSDGVELTRVDEDIAAVVAKNRTTLDGLVSTDSSVRYLAPNGTLRFVAKFTRAEDGADALLDGDRLIVAVHPRGSVGSEIRAFDRVTGDVLWSAEPSLPPIAHSAYVNEVRLSLRSGVIVVHGEEAAVDYVLLLERETGAVRLSDVVKVW